MAEIVSGSGRISIDFRVFLTPAGDTWKGFVTPPGVTVHGQTREDVLRLASDATDFMVAAFFKGPNPVATMRAYLDHHGVEYEIDEQYEIAEPLSAPASAQLQTEHVGMSREYQLA